MHGFQHFNYPPQSPQKGTDKKTASGDRNPKNLVVQNGCVWFSQAVEIDKRSAVQWHQFKLNGTKVQSGRIAHPKNSYIQTTLAVNAAEDVLIGFQETGPDMFISPRAVIDLRRPRDPEKNSEPLLLEEIGARYYPIPFRPDGPAYLEDEAKANPNATNMGEIYLYRISEKPFGKRLVDALEIIAESDNHPLVFHCSAGKDRAGILAAMVLAAMGVVDEDVVEDYTLC